MSSDLPNSHKARCGVVIAYVLAGITGAVGLAVWFLTRSLVLALLRRSSVSVWSWGAVDKFSFLLLAGVWLVSVILSQSYYERGSERGLLWPRFLRVFGLEILALALIAVSLLFTA